jgi:hypothetical protein
MSNMDFLYLILTSPNLQGAIIERAANKGTTVSNSGGSNAGQTKKVVKG